MRQPRFQFTIRHSLAVIAVCAVGFALLRTSFGWAVFWFLWAGSLFPGFLMARARGGHGIFGGAASFSSMTTLLFLAALILFESPDPPPISIVLWTFMVLCLVFPAAFCIGLLASGSLYLIVEVTQILMRIEPLARTSGPRRLYPNPDWPVQFDNPRQLYPEPDWPVQFDNPQGEQPS
jgi:hypothetical protein